MTKQLKKGLLTVLLFVMSICCAFSVNSFATVKAADATFAQNLANFKTAASIVDDAATDGVDESVIAENDARVYAAMENGDATAYFILMYKAQTMGQLTKAESDLFAPIMSVYNNNGAVDFYAGVTSTAYNIANKKGYSYRNHTDVEKLEASFATLNATDLKFLNSIPNFVFVDVNGVSTPKDLADARVKIDAWKAVIDGAIAKVKAIQVTVDGSTLVPIHDGSNYLAQHTVVIESKDSVDAARAAITVVEAQGDASFVENETKLVKAAEDALAASEKAIADVEKLIKDAYALYEQGKCYTNKEGIYAAYNAYRALNGGDNGPVVLNDLFKMVNDEQDEQIATLKDLCDTEEHKIKGCPVACPGHRGEVYYGVENFIDDIELVDDAATEYAFSYTAVTRAKIDEALENVKGLAADVKADAANCIANYQDLLDAEDAWKAYVVEIDAMIKAFNDLLPIEQSSRKELFAAMNAAFQMPLSDKENQLSGDNGQLKGFNNNQITPVNPGNMYNEDITTSQGLYNHYTEIISGVRAATMGISAKLDELLPMAVRFNNAFDTLFNDVKKEIENLKDAEGVLDELYIGAIGVSKYEDFLDMVDEYANLLDVAEDWADAVVAIGEVCTDKFDKIDAASAAYDAIVAIYPAGYVAADDLAVFSVKYNEKAYSEYSEELNSKSLDYIVLQLAIAEAVADADRLVRPELAGDYATYASEVARATNSYEALKAFDKGEDVCAECDTQKYYQDTYKDSYAAYLKAIDYVAANTVETAIAKISVGEDANNILVARVAYDALTDAQKEVVRNIKDLTDAEGVVNGFIENVDALLKGAAFDGSDVDADDVVYDADALTDGFYKLDVVTASKYVADYNEMSPTLKAYSYIVYGEDDTTSDDDVTISVAAAKALLDSMIAVAGTEKATKLADIDAEISDYLDYYKSGVGVAPDKNVIQAHIDALDKTQRDLLENYGDWEVLKNDFAMAAELAKAIIELNGTKDITEDTVANYFVVRAIYESLSEPQKALINVSALYVDGIDSTEDVLDTIEAKLDKAEIISIKDLQAAINALDSTYATDEQLKAEFDKLNNQISAVKGMAEDLKNNSATKEEMKAAYEELYKKILGVDEYFGKLVAETKVALENSIKEEVKTLNATIAALAGKDNTATVAGNAAAIKANLEAINKLNALVGQLPAEFQGDLVAYVDAAEKDAKDYAKEYVDGVIAALKAGEIKANADAIAELKGIVDVLDDTYATDKALNDAIAGVDADLKAAVAKLNKTITIITVILAVVSVACAGAIVYIFLKKRA